MISRCSFDFYTVLYMMEVSGEFPPVQPPMHRLHLNGFVSRVILRVRDSVASRRGSRMLDIRGMRLFRFRGPGRCILDGSVPTLKRCPDIARHPCRNVSTMQRSSSLSRTLPSCPGISWSVDWHGDGGDDAEENWRWRPTSVAITIANYFSVCPKSSTCESVNRH